MVGERINTTVAQEMQWASRAIAQRHVPAAQQQVRFNDKGEARVVRVTVPAPLDDAPSKEPTTSQRGGTSSPVASTSRSTHHRTRQQHESLHKVPQEGRDERGWEVEMPLRFRVVREPCVMAHYRARRGSTGRFAVRSPRCFPTANGPCERREHALSDACTRSHHVRRRFGSAGFRGSRLFLSSAKC